MHLQYYLVLNSLLSNYLPFQMWQSLQCTVPHKFLEVLRHISSEYIIIIGYFNVNWANEVERTPLYNLLIREKNYKYLFHIIQLIPEQLLITYTQTSQIDILLQGYKKPIFLIIKPFGYPFRTKALIKNTPEIYNNYWKPKCYSIITLPRTNPHKIIYYISST